MGFDIERIEQIMWTTEYEADIESDLSAFHRVDDPATLDGPRYFRLALRLTAYMGVLAARAHAESENGGTGAHGAHSAAPAAPSPGRPVHVSDEAALAMLADGWVEHVTEGEA